MAESSDVHAVFFLHDKKVAVISLGVDLDPFLERVRSGESIPIPRSAIGIRATHLRIESGATTLYVMTVDHLTDDAGKASQHSFQPACALSLRVVVGRSGLGIRIAAHHVAREELAHHARRRCEHGSEDALSVDPRRVVGVITSRVENDGRGV